MATSPRKPRRAVTGRAIVLGALIVLLLVLLASPLNRYFASRSALNSQAHQLQTDQRQLAELTKQVARWSDPGYIERQARTRLQYAMPGDTTYIVVDKSKGGANEITRTATPPRTASGATAWNTKLWDSISRADSDK
jgi:cell division protein FtsB